MKIILLGGKANTGKDSTAEYIDEYYRSRGLDVVNIQIGYYIKMYAKEIAKWDGDNETKPRQLLQDLGTELIRKQRQKRIMNAIDSLKPKLREVIVMYEMQEMSYEEISSKLKCPVGTIRSRLFNARKELSILLQDLI